MLIAGIAVLAEFAWTAPALMKAIQDAAQIDHLTLGLLGAVYGGMGTIEHRLIGAVGGVLLIVLGILLMRRSGWAPSGTSRQQHGFGTAP